jgi:polyhydroxyalkanoate synthase subunit PhaC
VLELIQYHPQTDEVYEVPVLIVPPTINKYYAIDLAPGRSLVEHSIQQGRQLFVISWRNPDGRHANWNFETYVTAILEALDAVERITRSPQTVLGGICSGGILASITAAYLAGIGKLDRVSALCLAVTVMDATARAPPRPSPRDVPPRRPRRRRAVGATSTAVPSPRSSRGSARAI